MTRKKKRMRLLITIILIALLSLAAEYFFPWWSIAIVCYLVMLFAGFNSGKAFLAGFAGVFFLWLAIALIKDIANAQILSSRMAELFHLPHYFIYILIAAVVGGLVGGLAGWSGAVVKNYFRQRQ
jgi:hypothetical protein